MPCSDGVPETWRDKENSAIISKLTKRNNELAQLLCSLCRQLEGTTNYILPDNVAEWWTEHKEFDRKRLEREAKANARKIEKEEALAKLTPRERKLLGLPN